jgi:hypothetical protein
VTRKELNELLSPFGHKGIDRTLIVIFMSCITNVIMTMRTLDVYPAPIPVAAQVVRYLLEEDSTACYGQNTKLNRKLKDEKNIDSYRANAAS